MEIDIERSKPAIARARHVGIDRLRGENPRSKKEEQEEDGAFLHGLGAGVGLGAMYATMANIDPRSLE
jgi:hypothetical protein